VSKAEAGLSTRRPCTTNTIGACVARLLLRLRFVVTGLIVSVESPWTSALGAKFNDNVLASVALEVSLALPLALLLVDVVTLAVSIAPCRRALALVGVLDVYLHAVTDERAERRILGTDIVVAVGSAEIVPKVVFARDEIVFHLNDTGRCDLIAWQVTKLHRDSTVSQFAIGHALVGHCVGRDGDGFVIVASPFRFSRTNGPRVDIVGAVVDIFDVFLC
jgi:hypothetical protein